MNVAFERNNRSEEWLTPPEIIRALGKFDLDPCSPLHRPWDTARQHFTKKQDGLIQPWEGRVFCNPPYGTQTGKWLDKCAQHGNAIALVFARTETIMFFDAVWQKADAILFIKGRLKFYSPQGIKGDAAGAPSVLVAYGKKNARQLQKSGITGMFISLK